jgi:Domain of unknown function (DUF4326)
MPERVRLSRARGWRKPANTVVVARPSRWGNPFTIKEHGGDFSREDAVARFSEALLTGELPFSVGEVKQQLRGKNLACWCPLDKACHADVLLEVANS